MGHIYPPSSFCIVPPVTNGVTDRRDGNWKGHGNRRAINRLNIITESVEIAAWYYYTSAHCTFNFFYCHLLIYSSHNFYFILITSNKLFIVLSLLFLLGIELKTDRWYFLLGVTRGSTLDSECSLEKRKKYTIKYSDLQWPTYSQLEVENPNIYPTSRCCTLFLHSSKIYGLKEIKLYAADHVKQP